MAMKMRRPRELCRTEVTRVTLRNGRLVASVRTHPRDGSRFGQLDELAIDTFECWCRLDAAARTRSPVRVVRAGRHRYEDGSVVSNNGRDVREGGGNWWKGGKMLIQASRL